MSSSPLNCQPTYIGIWATFVLITLFSKQAFSAPQDEARERAKQTLAEVELESRKVNFAPEESIRYNPISLLAAAELHVKAEQYDTAVIKLNKVIELRLQGKASFSTEVEARFLLAEAYFATSELYSARREFTWIVEQASKKVSLRFMGPAVSRLVDVALRVQRADELPELLRTIDKLLQTEKSDALRYARGKTLFAMGQHLAAGQQAQEIRSDAEYLQRGYYLRGVALMRSLESENAEHNMGSASRSLTEGGTSKKNQKLDYSRAIESFLKATVSLKKKAPADLMLSTGARRRQRQSQRTEGAISDMAWLAVARLYYEQKSFIRAANAYAQVDETSLYYARALFELAWTYVRLSDYSGAAKVLDVLSVLDPGLLDGADAALLRGDLLLRSGKYELAEDAYEEVKGIYDPLRKQIEEYLEVTVDSSIYYDKLTASDIETGYDLPPLVIDVAREEAGANRVFAIVDDVARSRRLVRESKQMVEVLQAALNTSARAKLFPNLLSSLRSTVALMNQLSQAEASIARGFDEVDDTTDSELLEVRDSRRQLMAEVGRLPTTIGDFSIRAASAERKWQGVSQGLQRLELEADHLQAIVNSLRQVLDNSTRYGLNSDMASLARFRLEMAENEKDLKVYRERINELRRQVQIGRVQTGFGDETFQQDVLIREKFTRLLKREAALSQLHSRKDEKSYVRKASPVLKRIQIIRTRLQAMVVKLNTEAVSLGAKMSQLVQREADLVDDLEARLDTLDQDARLLVGEVARNNFLKVRDRMRNVVMRADVGLVQYSWKIREKQQRRLRMLLRSRAREERYINDELSEVLDDQEVN